MQLAKRFIIACGITLLPSLLHCRPILAAEPKKDAARLQKELNENPWRWNDSDEGIFYSMSQPATAEYQIELIRPPGGDDQLTIILIKKGKLAFSWQGHSRSVFTLEGKTLVYAQFQPSSPDCTLVAVDLNSGRELWRNDLQGVRKPVGSSVYENRVLLYASDGLISVLGNESRGNYVEIVDMKTGKTLAHKVYAKEVKRAGK
jgi:hypothetical protein